MSALGQTKETSGAEEDERARSFNSERERERERRNGSHPAEERRRSGAPVSGVDSGGAEDDSPLKQYVCTKQRSEDALEDAEEAER